MKLFDESMSLKITGDNARGQRFSKLRFICFDRINNKRRTKAWFICDCKNIVLKNISKVIMSCKLYKTTSCTCACPSTLLDKGTVIKKNKLYHYKYRALKNGLAFTLTDDEVFKLFDANCFYCKIEPGLSFNGIDRVNNCQGYTKTNCVSCCMRCNQSKGSLELEKLYFCTKRIKEHQKNKDIAVTASQGVS